MTKEKKKSKFEETKKNRKERSANPQGASTVHLARLENACEHNTTGESESPFATTHPLSRNSQIKRKAG
jgi:hypothetical protein